MPRARSFLRATALGAPAFLTLLATLVVRPGVSHAIPADGGLPPEEPEIAVVGTLRLEDLPLLGTTVDITGENIEIDLEDGIPLPSYSWSIVQAPSGSTSSLGGGGLRRTLYLDKAGIYKVRLTACATGCSVKVGTRTLIVPGREIDLTFEAKAEISTPQQLWPSLPYMGSRATNPQTIPSEDIKCNFGPVGGAVWDRPQWVTTKTFVGPSDYVLAEGVVQRSHVAGNDNPLNHDSGDWNIHIVPDMTHRHLLNANITGPTAGPHDEMEIEWERGQFPEAFRPTRGDRVSVFGYHILDCGHPTNPVLGPRYYRTEIHPPVLTAVHRPRAFQLPADQPMDLDRDGVASETVGTNVWVAGVVTDLWANGTPGGVLGGWNPTNLHQPASIPTLPGGTLDAPSNIKRSYTFNIYLPKSPQQIAKAMGKTDAKPTPLYYAAQRHPKAPADAPMGPAPTIVPVIDGDVTYLKVTLDLTGYTGGRLAQQIVAGWVYPSADNWQLEQWRLSVPSIRVHSDSDPIPLDDGDWRFWVGTNNATNEWTKIFDCNGCIDSDTTYTPSSGAWRSGSTGTDGRIFGDLPLYPAQSPWLYVSAREEDPISSDGLGYIAKALPRADGAGQAKADHFALNWTLQRVGTPTATLTTAGNRLFQEYKFVGTSAPPVPQENAPVALVAKYTPKVRTDVVPLLDNVSASSLKSSLATRPESELLATLTALRTKVDAALAAKGSARTKILASLTPLRDVVPTAAWNASFGDLLPKS